MGKSAIPVEIGEIEIKGKFNNHQFKLRSLKLIISIAFVITQAIYQLSIAHFLIADNINRKCIYLVRDVKMALGRAPLPFPASDTLLDDFETKPVM